MPRGKPTRGFRRTVRYKTRTLQDIEQEIQSKTPELVEKLENLTKPIVCPECGHVTEMIDKDVAMFLIDHGIGKPRQKLEVDITERIVLSSVQIEKIMQRYQLAQRLMLPEGLTKGVTETKLSQGGKDV